MILLLALLAATAGANAPTYVGAAACIACHDGTSWTASRHSKMVQPATAAGVKGNFGRGRVVLRGSGFLLEHSGGAFYITETYLSKKPQRHRIEYTLGNRRIQHYLTTLADGRIVILPPTWDILRKRWFHNLDIDDPEEEPGVLVQVWNKHCYSCHVSKEEKHFDVSTATYKTKWIDFGIDCERCHAPGSEHVAHTEGSIVLQTKLDAKRNTMVCAQCHSFRDIFVDGFTAGSNYYDYFRPVLEYSLPTKDDPAYWADGRTRRFSNDALGLWLSECFLKGGATCVRCHSTPHNTNVDKNPQLRADNNALCAGCHAAIGADVEKHSHHATSSAGSSCVDCHMPRTVFSIKAEIRDHSMSIPSPENTIAHKIPNACNLCHKDRDAEWSRRRVDEWYGAPSSRARRGKLIRRADAFGLARQGDPAAVQRLIAILSEPAEGPLARANAAGYLGGFSRDASATAALFGALSDADANVRLEAILALRPGGVERSTFIAAATGLLADPVNTVRIGAMLALSNLGIRQLPGDDGARLELARQLYLARADLNSDDANQEIATGKFFLLEGQPDRAIGAFQASLRLDPESPVRQLLANAYIKAGRLPDAIRVLESATPRDPEYSECRKLLERIRR